MDHAVGCAVKGNEERRQPTVASSDTRFVLRYVIRKALRCARLMSTLSIRLSAGLDAVLTEEARLTNQPKSLVVRTALEQFLASRRHDRLLRRLARAAAAVDAGDAIALADEALPLDNESLAFADGPGSAHGKP